jgi:uridine phosphorylase
VVAELVTLGGRRLIRVGTAAGLGATAPGTIVVAAAALAADGASRALGAGGRATADAALTAALAAAAGAEPALVASADIHDPVLAADWAARGAVAADLATAAVLAAAARAGATAAAVVGITRAGGERLDDAAVEALEQRLGAAALAALPA